MPRFEIRQVVVFFESFSMLETCRTYIDAYHAGFRMADRILRCLPRSASGDEHIEIGAVLLFGPQQMMFGAVDILIPPHIASTVQLFQGWRKRVTRVEVADGIGVRFSRFRLHECFTCSETWGARIIHCHQSKTSLLFRDLGGEDYTLPSIQNKYESRQHLASSGSRDAYRSAVEILRHPFAFDCGVQQR